MHTDTCTHIAISHKEPRNFTEAYDNLTLLLSTVKGLFCVLHRTLSGDENDYATVAYLGGELCSELERRANSLYEMHWPRSGREKNED
jgi:hypothetical protein